MTYIILGIWLVVSLLIVVVANAVKDGETDDFINMVSFVWPVWLPILLAFLILNTFPVELGKYIGKKIREKQKALSEDKDKIIVSLNDQLIQARQELAGYKNYRGE